MHTGVDWGAPIGTPVYAAGNGVIIKAGWDGGYGRRVEIQHANGYVTAYNHMSGFGRGIAEGAHVVQGQTVGYLGDSGLATGPHLHYEVIINGSFVDPMAIKLPRTREFDGRMLAAFKRERDRIDQIMGEAPSAVAMSADKSGPAPFPAIAEPQPNSTASPALAPGANPNAARTSPGAKPVARNSANDTD
jgi:murein DD-endopeptidase MepM/ murein hydrolase activator NlpD